MRIYNEDCSVWTPRDVHADLNLRWTQNSNQSLLSHSGSIKFKPRPEKICCCFFSNAKTNAQISCKVAKIAPLPPPFFLMPKCQDFGHLLRLYSPVCVGSGRKPRRQVFSRRGLFDVGTRICISLSRRSLLGVAANQISHTCVYS